MLYFVERPGQLLDKHTLIAALWSNVVVEESNLTQTIHTLRRLLGERPDEHRFIVTVPGRGYRFVADVTTPPLEELLPSQQPAKPRLLAAAAAAVVVLAGVAFWLLQGSRQPQRDASIDPPALSIAVLPFVDMSEAQDQAYFAEGLSEEILNLLAQSTTLRVTARTSSFSFKGRSVDIATIADTLKTTHVLEGSVRKSGGRVRHHGATRGWRDQRARLVADVRSRRDRRLRRPGRDRCSRRRIPAGDADRQLRLRRAVKGPMPRRSSAICRASTSTIVAASRTSRVPKSISSRPCEVDPDYARAWAGLAGVYQIARQQGLHGALPAWRAAVDQALKLGPNLAESHVRAAQYYWWAGDPKTSAAHCKRAIALNPSDPLVLSASAGRSFSAGHWSEGIALQRRAVAVDPLSATGRGNLGVYLAAIGEWEESIAELEKARELSPTLDRIDSDIARVQILRQQFDEALAAAGRMPAGPARDQCIALAHRAPGQQCCSGRGTGATRCGGERSGARAGRRRFDRRGVRVSRRRRRKR